MGATSEHFTNQELACHHCGHNSTVKELVDMLEAVRAAVGKPVIVNDAYRCPTHNAEVKGALKSWHLLGMAADIQVEGMSARELESIARTVPSVGGIGRDDKANYVHVDVRQRHTDGQVTCWCYDGPEAIPYYV